MRFFDYPRGPSSTLFQSNESTPPAVDKRTIIVKYRARPTSRHRRRYTPMATAPMRTARVHSRQAFSWLERICARTILRADFRSTFARPRRRFARLKESDCSRQRSISASPAADDCDAGASSSTADWQQVPAPAMAGAAAAANAMVAATGDVKGVVNRCAARVVVDATSGDAACLNGDAYDRRKTCR